MDQTWKDWTGLRELLSSLDHDYLIKRVHCFKACNIKPDVFKYGIIVEIAGEDDLIARDALQKFRLRRMSGYVALYKTLDDDGLLEAYNANELTKAKQYNMA